MSPCNNNTYKLKSDVYLFQCVHCLFTPSSYVTPAVRGIITIQQFTSYCMYNVFICHVECDIFLTSSLSSGSYASSQNGYSAFPDFNCLPRSFCYPKSSSNCPLDGRLSFVQIKITVSGIRTIYQLDCSVNFI